MEADCDARHEGDLGFDGRDAGLGDKKGATVVGGDADHGGTTATCSAVSL